MAIETEKEHKNTIFTEEQFIKVSDYLGFIILKSIIISRLCFQKFFYRI